MNEKIQYQPSWGSVFLAIARGEHLRPATCPHCQSKDVNPTDETYQRFECTTCGEVFDRPLT